MALREYRWHGLTWQIADEDVALYPGAELVEKPSVRPARNRKASTPKSREAANKAQSPANKARKPRAKAE